MDETSDLGQSRGLETHLHRHGVRSALTADFLHLPAEQPLSEASRRMAAHRQTAAVVAFAEGDPGIVTERDVLRVLAEQVEDPPLADVAARPMATVAADTSLLAARERMRAQGIRHLGVTDGEGGLMGLLEFSDLLAASEAGLVQQLEADRTEAHAQEQRANALYEEMFHRNTAPKLLIEPESGYIADANPAALAFYGYSQAEIRQLRIQDINQLSAADTQAERDKACREDRRYFEFRHQLADGDIRDVKVYSGPVAVEGGTYLHSIIHDVTEAKHYLAYLERYKTIFDTLPVGVYRNSPGTSGAFEEANPAMANIFGAESVAEFLRYPTAALYRSPAERSQFSEELLARGEVHRREVALQTIDGRPLWGAITARVRYDADGAPYFDGVVEDVTERHRAERERDHLIEIMEATPDYIGMADPAGHILYENPALRRMRSTSGQTAEGEHFLGGHPRWAAQRLNEEALPAATEAGTWQGETALYDSAGHTLPVSQTLVAHRDEEGAIQRYSTIMRDISASREAETFRRQLLDSLAEGVFGIDTAGNFTFLNPAACRLLGFASENEALGHNAHALTHHTRADGQPYPPGDCPISRVQASGQAREAWEDWFWRRDGTGFPAEVFAAPLADAEGYPEGVVVSFQDITRRKAAEAARDRVLAILDATPDFVSMSRADGNITYINRGGLRMLGEDPDRTGLEEPLPDWLATEQAGELAHPQWARRVLAEEAMPIASRDGIWQGETSMVDTDGREIPTSQVVLAHHDERGQVVYYSTILRDISAQRALEAELRRETTFSQAIVRNLPGIFYLIDADGRFQRWNRRLEEVTGYEGKDALTSIHPSALYPQGEQELINEGIAQVFREGSATVEAHLCHREGHLTPYYLTGYRVELEGEPYLLGVGLDISDRKDAESELERSNAELEAFAYAVSHDLQEPLRIINSYLGLLQHRYSASLDERAARYIQTTTEAGDRMRRMINDLLEYSRVKRMGEAFQRVDLNRVAAEAHSNLESAVTDSGAEIHVANLPEVVGDRGQLVRLFQNLLSNAIKYGRPEEGTRITVSSRAIGGQYEVAVADNGIGIDPAHTDRIFQVFQRLHTRDEHAGTGAGLALAQRIVERHGGTIWVESGGDGMGSTFRFTLKGAADTCGRQP
ncbi:MAG TPA: PAS domain S-box protein [Gammaproteobacteria bacterium]|nr:PAS domain S-box protein [Gammaproteobacteria bacterium]